MVFTVHVGSMMFRYVLDVDPDLPRLWRSSHAGGVETEVSAFGPSLDPDEVIATALEDARQAEQIERAA